MSIRMILTAVAVLAVAACSDDDGPSGPAPATFGDVIASGGDFAEVEEKEVVTDSAQSTELRPDSAGRLENWMCTTRTYEVTEAPSDFPLFDPNSEIVFPGNLLQGETLEQATPDPIPVNRGPGRIVITLMNGAEMGVSRQIPEASLGAVYDAANDVIANSPEEIPARFFFTMERVDSREQLAAALKVDVNQFFGSVSSALSFSTDRKYNRFLVTLNQSFYTIAFELPTSYGQMFSSDVTPDDLSRYVGPGNPAAFISSVSYGRIFHLLIESTERTTEMEASLNASFSGWDTEASGKYVGELENLNVKAFALGGDASQALSAVTSDFDDLKSFLSEGGTIRTGVPISYVVRSVRNPDRIVKVAINTEYDVKDCEPMRETFGEPIIWLLSDNPNIETHASDATRVTRWPDMSTNENDAFIDGTPSVQNLPRLQPTVVNGEMPAIAFGDSAVMRFVGADFADSDYTLTMVAAFRLNPDYGHLFDFIGGTTPSPGRMLCAGFTQGDPQLDPVELAFDHYNAGVTTVRVPFTEQYHVYTFMFSRDRGMSIYIDGHDVGWNPSATEPLIDFLGARLGNVLMIPDASVSIAELIAYDTALDDEQRHFLEDDMMRRYKF